MLTLQVLLPWIQIILSVLLVAAILLQQSEGSMGSAFGGSQTSNPFHTKRGFEKQLFVFSICVGILFIASTVIALFVK